MRAEVFRRLGVDGRVVGIDVGVEIDLRLRDVQKTPRLAGGPLARLGARQDIVRRRQHLAGAARGPDGARERVE